MKKLICLSVAAMLTTTLVSAASGDSEVKAPIVVAEQDRSIPGGRAVQVTLVQRDIDVTIELGRVAHSDGNGGLLGLLVTSSMDRQRRGTMGMDAHDAAERNVLPVRGALADMDVDSLALSTTKAALAKPDWFGATDFVASKESSTAAFQATAGTSQLAYITYRYELSPDFSQIRVYADLRIDRRVPQKVGKIVLASGPIYHQRILSVVQLRARTYEPRDNARIWSAANGRLAKAGMTLAFKQFESLIPYALSLSDADVKGFAVKTSEKAFAASYYGPLIVRNAADPDDILIWNNGLIHIQSIS
ncbi:hypothetical protein [Sphingomonas sp.]|jgi:hypothetical protein|uniref:hypothetical protein n=1 Tax=Sphingomonas sp. TaxID=28214 RepID=UPI002E35BDC7|nr:hypothetical protein [Sphingomonas sp.]HEX4694174.1 hypothetical protein [Sphingomonas sp.]